MKRASILSNQSLIEVIQAGGGPCLNKALEWSKRVNEEAGKLPKENNIPCKMAETELITAHCIGKLLKKGYKKEQVLMIGDAPGDLEAAEKNGVGFYPILVGMENQSWQEFMEKGIHMLVSNQYLGVYQDQKIKEFMNQLRGRG